MKRVFWPFVVLAVIGGSVLWRQQQAKHGQLVAELGRARALAAERRQIAAENLRLGQALPSPTERDAFRATEHELSAVRSEIAALETRLARGATAPAATPAATRFAPKRVVPAAEWQNVGNATANATLETVLWAAAGGDVEAFARNLSLPEGKARERAMALWESLPASLRTTYNTPEQLLAFLSIKDVIVGTAEVMDAYQVDAPKPAAAALLRLATSDGKTRDIHLTFAKEGDGWKVIIPEPVIARYATQLAGNAAAGLKPGEILIKTPNP